MCLQMPYACVNLPHPVLQGPHVSKRDDRRICEEEKKMTAGEKDQKKKKVKARRGEQREGTEML